jgi:hypothetical protein
MAYATTDDLGDYLSPDAPPANAARLLERASDLVDEMLIGAIYDVNDDGDPTDADVAAALTKATCAQAQFMMATGDETGAHTGGTVKVGDVQITRPASTGRSPGGGRYAPAALGALRVAGLRPVGPITRRYW